MKINSKYNNRKEVLEDLLFELDDLCIKNNLKYTLIGKVADSVFYENKLPDDYCYASIAMTQGDVEKLIEIVNSKKNSSREIEYFLNNEKAIKFQFRYCNNDTTLINVKEIGRHINYGVYVRIYIIKKDNESRIKQKFLTLCKKAWIGSQLNLKVCNYLLIIPAIILKFIVLLCGKNNIKKWLYSFDSNIHYLNKWEDISSCEKVIIGNKVYISNDWSLKEYNINKNSLRLAESVVDSNIEKIPTHSTIMENDFVNVNLPFKEIVESNLMEDLYEVRNKRNKYLRIVSLALKPTKVMNHAWKTYLMTRDVIHLRNLYDEEKITIIKNAIHNCDYEIYQNELKEYLEIMVKWNKTNISFIRNEKVEELLLMIK